ncbi:MAG: acetyltransferase [Anaerolineae bacterium]|nr:acetyltransferase [Anaerolineae bacterium]
MKKILGLGAGGHTKVIIDALQLIGDYDIVGLLDPHPSLWGTKIMGVVVLGNDDLMPKLFSQDVHYAFIGLGSAGDTHPRKQLYESAKQQGFQIAEIIHPGAVIATSVLRGEGLTLMANAVVNVAVRLGSNVIINTGAIVEHDCVIGDHVHIATGARLAGTVIVGECTHIGIGATVRQSLSIGHNVIVGAGAVVVNDIPDNVVVVGVPARILRRRDT